MMDILDYSSRQLFSVDIQRLQLDRFPDGSPCVQVRVHAGLSSEDDPEIMGPSILFALALSIDLSTPVQDIEDAALRAAHALLVRMSQESLESLQTCLQKTREASVVTA